MPFAPVVLKNDFDDYFYKIEKKHSSSLHMTMTFKCKQNYKESSQIGSYR